MSLRERAAAVVEIARVCHRHVAAVHPGGVTDARAETAFDHACEAGVQRRARYFRAHVRLLQDSAGGVPYPGCMAPRFDLIGVVVSDMAASLAFYRRLGLDISPDSDAVPHVDFVLPGGLRMAFDTEETIRSFDDSWQAPSGGHRLNLAFECDSPADVDATYVSCSRRERRATRALGRVPGPAVRRGGGSRRQPRRPLRVAQLMSAPSGTPARSFTSRGGATGRRSRRGPGVGRANAAAHE